MKKIISLLFAALLASFLTSCAESTQEKTKTVSTPNVKVETPSGDTVVRMTNSQIKDYSIDGFTPGGSKIKVNEDIENMNKIIGLLKPVIEKLPDGYAMEIKGHAAAYPTKALQKSISKQRAYKVYSMLKKAGVPAKKLSYKGVGISEPLEGVDGKDAKQRRVSFTAIKK